MSNTAPPSKEKCNAQLVEALQEVCDWFGFYPAGKAPLDQWEDLAAEFFKETGWLRPGKDYPAVAALNDSQEYQRESAWEVWVGRRKAALAEKARAAIAAAKEQA